MPNSNLCEIIALLDRSGSMRTILTDTIGGFNAFVNEQKKAPGECAMTLVQFDADGGKSLIDTIYESKPIAEVPDLILEPRGWTPLLDAIGTTVTKIGKRYADTPEEKRPGKVIFMIITDGAENVSKEFDRAQIKKLIEEQTKVWKWEFTYLGANVDAFAEAASIGIPTLSAASFSHDSQGTRESYASLGSNVLRSRSGGAIGYSGAERKKMGGQNATTPPVTPKP